MEPVRIREDVDPNSPEYRRSLIIVTFIVLVLMLVGGSCLGYRIRQMENLGAGGQSSQSSVESGAPAAGEAPGRSEGASAGENPAE